MTALNSTFVVMKLASEESSLLSPDQMAGYAVTVLFTVINLVIAYIILKRFVFKPILKVIHNREEQIKSQVVEAEEANAKAKAFVEESRANIDRARGEAAEIIADARSVADKQAELIIKKSGEEATAILQRADEEAKRTKRVALEEMKDELSDLAVAISEKVMGDVVSRETLKEFSEKRTTETLEAEVKKIDEDN